MIVEAFMSVLIGLFNFVAGLIPTGPPPAWVTDAMAYLDVVWDSAAGLGAWIPWSLAGTVFGSLMACVALGFTIKVIRIIASFLTAGGGSAA